MKRGFIKSLSALATFVSIAVAPQHVLSQSPADATVTVHQGKCSSFKVGGSEYSCEKVLHSYYPKSDRQSFIFDIPDGLLGMSGIRTKRTSSGFTLFIDAVTVLQDDGKDTKKHDGKGTCTGTLSEDWKLLADIRCEAEFKGGKVSVQFLGNGEAGKTLQSQDIVQGIERFNLVYPGMGIKPVVGLLQECYRRQKEGNIESLAVCFGMDYTAYNIDEAMSERLGVAQHEYTRRAKMIARVNEHLKRLGYDSKARDRQIKAWIKRVEQWLLE